jgi:hypothetical protein
MPLGQTDLFGNLVQFVPVAATEDEFAVFLGESSCDCGADSPRRPGDDDYVVSEGFHTWLNSLTNFMFHKSICLT